MKAHSPIRFAPLLALLFLPLACKGKFQSSSSGLPDTIAPVASGSPTSRSRIAWTAWALTDSSFGPITIGMTPEQAQTAVGGTLELPQGLTADACDYAYPRDFDGLAFMIEGGRIVRVDVRRRDIHTDMGASVGDSQSRVEQLYPHHLRVSPHKYTAGHYLTVVPSDTVKHPFRLVFETDGDTVTVFRGGQVPQVEYVEGCS
jgi:hypothetical protein